MSRSRFAVLAEPAEVTNGARPCDNIGDRLPDVERAIRSVRYGEVRVTVCGGRVVQIDETRRTRYDQK